MANNDYIKELEKKQKKAAKIVADFNAPSKTKKQIGNYQKRLGNIGEDADSRNFIEKALNLPEDQNVLFDIFEILGRPQQAIFGAVNASQNKEDISDAALEGIKGDRKTHFKEILTDAGMNDTEGKLDLADIIGVVGDVALDPTNVAFGGAAKAVKGASKLAKGSDVVSNAGKVLGKLDDGGRVLNKTNKVVGYLDQSANIFKPIKKDLTQRAFGAAGKYVVKPVAKAADFGVSKTLQGVDALGGIKYTNANAKLAQDLGKILPTDIKETTDIKGALEVYKEAKSGIKNVFNFSKSVPEGMWNKLKGSEGKVRKAQTEAVMIGKGVEKSINDFATSKGIDIDVLDRQLALLTEDNLDKSININKIISNHYNKVEDGVIRVVDADKKPLIETLNKLKGAVNYKTLDNGDIKITSVKNKVLKSNPELLKNAEKISFTKRLDYSPEDLKMIENARNNPEILKFYSEKIEPSYRKVSEIFKKHTGIDFSPIANREGYLNRVVNRDALQTSGINKFYSGKKANTTKTFAGRKHDNMAVTNEMRKELPKETIDTISKRIERKFNELSDNKMNSLTARKVQLQDSISTNRENLTKKISKLDEQSTKILKSNATKEVQKISILNDLNRQNLKAYSKIATPEQLGSLMKYSSESDSLLKQLDNVIKDLDKPNLSNARMKQLINKLDDVDEKLLKAENKTYKILNDLEDLKLKNGLNSIKKTTKTFNESNKLTAQILKNNNKLGEIYKTKELIISSADDVVNNKIKQINYLNSQIKNIDPKKDAIILNQINRMKKDIDLLKSSEGKELFKISYTNSLFDFIDNDITKNAKGMLLMNDVLFDTAMNDSALIRAARVNETAPAGYKIMKSDSIIKEMENWDNLFKPESVTDFIENFKGSDIMIDKRLASMIEPNINPTTSNTILNVLDKFNNTFKKYKTLSPGFQMRNVAGGWTNMTLAGIPQNIAMPFSKAQRKSLRILSNAQELIEKSANNLLKGSEIKDYELLSKFIETGFLNSTAKLYDIEEILTKSSKNALGKGINKVANLNNNMNMFMDNMYKMTLLDYFEKNPAKLASSGYKTPIEAVKGILFSPNASDLSPFERNWMKRIVPFYTFTKQNLMFQFTNSIKNPTKYKQLIKASDAIWDGIYDDDTEYAKWEKEGFLLPLPFEDEKGNKITLKLNLPLSDLGEYMSNPLTRVAAATSPMLKAPFELTTGKDVFTGSDIPTNLVDLFGKYTGLDFYTNQPGKVTDLASGEQSAMQNLATLFPSLMRYNDTEKTQFINELEELKKYQEKVSELKDEGIEVPTIADINKNTTKAKIIMRNLQKNRKNYY